MSPAALTALSAHVGWEEGEGWIGAWSPGIGDPTVVGWLTVVAYLVAAYLCRRMYRKLPVPRQRDMPGAVLLLVPLVQALAWQKRRVLRWPPEVRLAALWLGFALVLLALGINKQLDLQSAITEIGRMVVSDMGLGAVHRTVQAFFIACVLLVGLWILRSVLLLGSGHLRQLAPALGGTIFILVFVAVRAISFHHFDYFLADSVLGIPTNWLLELGGIGLIIFGTVRELRALGRRPKKVMAEVVVSGKAPNPPPKPKPAAAASKAPGSGARRPPAARR